MHILPGIRELPDLTRLNGRLRQYWHALTLFPDSAESYGRRALNQACIATPTVRAMQLYVQVLGYTHPEPPPEGKSQCTGLRLETSLQAS